MGEERAKPLELMHYFSRYFHVKITIHVMVCFSADDVLLR